MNNAKPCKISNVFGFTHKIFNDFSGLSLLLYFSDENINDFHDLFQECVCRRPTTHFGVSLFFKEKYFFHWTYQKKHAFFR